MSFDYYLSNDQIKPILEAKIMINNLEFSYGFGVYENLKVKNNKIFFLEYHLERLFNSAFLINLSHKLEFNNLKKNIQDFAEFLSKKNKLENNPNFNLKIILVGNAFESSDLYVFASNPKFVDKKFYKKGCQVLAIKHQRFLPNCKSLNMLPSYLAHKEALNKKCYDSLLINEFGNIAEGTRTNFFALKNRTIFSNSKIEILEGITYKTVLEVALKNNYTFEETELKLENIEIYDSLFLTSTSIKILPINKIIIPQKKDIMDIFALNTSLKEVNFGISKELKELMEVYKKFLNELDFK
jgi:branched-chain amino acid aminotransferase